MIWGLRPYIRGTYGQTTKPPAATHLDHYTTLHTAYLLYSEDHSQGSHLIPFRVHITTDQSSLPSRRTPLPRKFFYTRPSAASSRASQPRPHQAGLVYYDDELTGAAESFGGACACVCVHTLSGCPLVHRFLSSPLFMPSAMKVPIVKGTM